MDRRLFLTSLAATVAAGLTGCADEDREPDPRVFAAPQGIVKVPLPHGTLHRLPGKTNHIALTVDDGTNPAVVEGYAKLCRDTGLRVTFFGHANHLSVTKTYGKLVEIIRARTLVPVHLGDVYQLA